MMSMNSNVYTYTYCRSSNHLDIQYSQFKTVFPVYILNANAYLKAVTRQRILNLAQTSIYFFTVEFENWQLIVVTFAEASTDKQQGKKVENFMIAS